MFINRFNELCREKNVTRYKLSTDLQIGNSTIYGWEKGQQPTADKLIKLADYFEVSTDYLLGRSNDVGVIETNANLTQDQQELLSLYSKMSFQDKNQLIGFAKALVY